MAGLEREQRLALAFLAVGALCGGFASIFIKLCRYPAPVMASLRMLLAGLVLLPFCWRGLRSLVAERGLKGVLPLIVPGLALAAHFQSWVAGVRLTSVANATFIVSINPVFFALFERFFRRQKVPPYGLAALALGLAGALWLFLFGRGRLGQLGDLACLAATLLFVFYLLVSRKVSAGVPHLVYVHLIYFWGGLASLPIALIHGQLAAVRLADTGSLLALLGLVFLPTLVGHTAVNYGVRHLAPLTVSFFSLAEPLVATSAAVLLLGERLAALTLPAYGLLLAATLLYLLQAARRRSA
jgi:drug/metabolite transporter (DMT)-like permease